MLVCCILFLDELQRWKLRIYAQTIIIIDTFPYLINNILIKLFNYLYGLYILDFYVLYRTVYNIYLKRRCKTDKTNWHIFHFIFIYNKYFAQKKIHLYKHFHITKAIREIDLTIMIIKLYLHYLKIAYWKRRTITFYAHVNKMQI